MKVAFLGTGAMGYGIALNILKAEFNLSVWNIKDAFYSNAEKLAEGGAKLSQSIEEAVKGADIVCLSLLNDKIVSLVGMEALSFMKKSATMIDFSTTSAYCASEIYKAAVVKEIGFLDAPVSGGEAGAVSGTLCIMIGGDEEVYKKAVPIFEATASKFELMGKNSSGQATKIINQLLTGVNQATTCEAMTIAKKLGLDLDKLYSILTNAWGQSRMLDRTVLEYIKPENYESAACLKLMQKDLNLAVSLADFVGYDVPLTKQSLHFYDKATEEGLGNEDHSAIIKIMYKENKKETKS